MGSSGFDDGMRNPNGEEKTSLLGIGYSADDRKDRFKEELEGTVNWSDRHDDSRSSRETFLANGNVFSRSQDINNSRSFGSDISNKWELRSPESHSLLMATTANTAMTCYHAVPRLHQIFRLMAPVCRFLTPFSPAPS